MMELIFNCVDEEYKRIEDMSISLENVDDNYTESHMSSKLQKLMDDRGINGEETKMADRNRSYIEKQDFDGWKVL